MSVINAHDDTNSRQLLDLLHWAMLTLDEDEVSISQPERVVKRVRMFEKMQPFLEKIEECLVSMLYTYPRLNYQLWKELEKSADQLSKDDLLKQLADKLNQTEKTHHNFITELIDYLQEMNVELDMDHILWEVRGYFFDDVAAKINQYQAHRNGQVFNELVQLVRRKIKAVASLRALWQLKDETVEAKLEQICRSASIQLGQLQSIPAKIVARAHNTIRPEVLEDIWNDTVQLTISKLRKGNVSLDSGDRLINLMSTIAMYKINALFRGLDGKTDFVDTEEKLSWRSLLDDEDIADVLDREETYGLMVSSSKLGFDFLSTKNDEKTILYLGYFIPNEFVTEAEIRKAREAYQFAPDKEIDQQSIIRTLKLGITQSALSKRINGDNKKEGRSYGYFKKWCNYTYGVLARLKTERFDEGKAGLIDFFYGLSYFELTQKEEAPQGDEPWYESTYKVLKERVIRGGNNQVLQEASPHKNK